MTGFFHLRTCCRIFVLCTTIVEYDMFGTGTRTGMFPPVRFGDDYSYSEFNYYSNVPVLVQGRGPNYQESNKIIYGVVEIVTVNLSKE